MMPYWTPHGEKITCKYQLGCTTGDALLLAYREVHQSIHDSINDAFKGGFPVDIVRGALHSLNDLLYGLTWRAVCKLGVKIGDESYGMIFGRAEEEINKVKAKVDEAKKYIEDELIAPVNTKINDAKAKLNKLGINVDALETDVGKAMSEVSNMQTSISKFQSDIDAFASKLGSFDSKLGDLNSMANSLQSRLGDAEGSLSTLNDAIEKAKDKLREHTDLIDKLDTRIIALEEKKEPEVPKEKPKPLIEIPDFLKF